MTVVTTLPLASCIALAGWAAGWPLSAALAYIDPGTGALILQMLVGAVVGVLVFARNQVRRFVAWVGNVLGRQGSRGEGADGRIPSEGPARTPDPDTGPAGSADGGGPDPRDR